MIEHVVFVVILNTRGSLELYSTAIGLQWTNIQSFPNVKAFLSV